MKHICEYEKCHKVFVCHTRFCSGKHRTYANRVGADTSTKTTKRAENVTKDVLKDEGDGVVINTHDEIISDEPDTKSLLEDKSAGDDTDTEEVDDYELIDERTIKPEPDGGRWGA